MVLGNDGRMRAVNGAREPVLTPIDRWPVALRGHRNLIRGSAWLTGTVAASAVSGFTFWLLAARTYPEQPIGQAAGLFTSVLFVNYITSLGLPVAVGRYAVDRSDAADVLFGWAVLLTVGSSAVGTLVLVVVAGGALLEPLEPLGTLGGPLLFFAVTAGMSMALLVEARLTALRRWGWVLARVSVVGVVRLPLIGWDPIDDPALWLFLLVGALPAASVLGLVGALAARGRARLGRLPGTARQAARFAGVNYASMLALQAPVFALPLVVALQVSDDGFSSFYIAFQIATVAFLVPHMLTQVLLVEGGRESADLNAQVRVALVGAVGIMTAVALGGLVLARVVPEVYGAEYQDAGDLLPLLLVAGIPWAITSVILTRARVVEAERAIVAIGWCLALGILVPASVLTAVQGTEGAAVGWLIGHLVAASVALLVARNLPGGRSRAADLSVGVSSRR
jgi:O-antigen/teichoic acid export membrane protein